MFGARPVAMITWSNSRVSPSENSTAQRLALPDDAARQGRKTEFDAGADHLLAQIRAHVLVEPAQNIVGAR